MRTFAVIFSLVVLSGCSSSSHGSSNAGADRDHNQTQAIVVLRHEYVVGET
ncbi:MAG TPA: hypothetical protein VHC69_08800 [Polyangiaceae bacterium]|nr:hypothetical protein [Polyangiaceae bacterium]